MVNSKGGFVLWILLGAIGGAIGLLALSKGMEQEFPMVVYLGFIVGWSVVGFGLFRAGKLFGSSSRS
ncbi:hypothetical protein E3E35_06630 [Thermococcus sp. GR7]|uniref:hypothetical protein n=1 Tax=unclassified Thermococcus TaxID=2627626 RepID=UPI001430CEAA|nr:MULTISPECIES: hypothetical protein [unclassified Thermococcus]NJE47079.1 hypothetical protein [Thermococcus sp. GR7]NJE78096.1 hypothetical protein [Thermococcus sp. GR4]NJF22787.1 hypothetical protein [Thermococcus sp. GR5]